MYRVEVSVNLFNRLVDLHNFDLVLGVLTPYEIIACVQCRIGILHYFNPMKPEGIHTVDLGIRDERLVAKMLAALSYVEPGENWVKEYSHFDRCVIITVIHFSWEKRFAGKSYLMIFRGRKCFTPGYLRRKCPVVDI